MMILVLFAGLHTFIPETLVESDISYLMIQLFSLPMLSFRFVMITVTQCYTMYNIPKRSISMLQRIQNQAARILTRTPRRDHITEVLIGLHWFKIEERIVYKIVINK